jgi:hypothetical protein
MKSYRSLGYRIAGAIILAAAGLFQAIPASFAYSRSWTLAGLTVQVGTYLPITLAPQLNVLESQDASGSVFAEWIQLHHPKGSPLPDYYLKVSDALAQGNVTIPMQNLSGNPIRVLGLGLSPSFDVYKGGQEVSFSRPIRMVAGRLTSQPSGMPTGISTSGGARMRSGT